MAVQVEQIEEGFRLVDGDNGPDIYQRYRVDFLQGMPDTWIDQAENGAPNPLPRRGDHYSNTLYQDATCRYRGIETIIDGQSCFMFAIFRRGRWGPGPRRVTRASQANEEQAMPIFWRKDLPSVGGPIALWEAKPKMMLRTRFDRIETRWIPGDAAAVSVLQVLMGQAQGYIYTIGSTPYAVDYLFLGGDAWTDGYSSIRVNYQFVRWNRVDALDFSSGGSVMLPLPALGPFDQWVESTDAAANTPVVQAKLMPIVRLTGTGPSLPGM